MLNEGDTIMKIEDEKHVTPSQIDWNSVGLGKRSDRAIGKELGVHHSIVLWYREKLGIPAYEKTKIDWDQSPLGEMPDCVLARKLKVSRSFVRDKRKEYGIPSYRSTKSAKKSKS